MKLIVAFLMAFGFYGLSFGQSDTSSRIPDTTGMTGEEPTLSCYMVDESTFLCTVDEPAEGSENWNENEGTLPGSEDDVYNQNENESDIEGREEDILREDEYPSGRENESDEGVLPESDGNQTESESEQKHNDVRTY